jgi:hypothetical protein
MKMIIKALEAAGAGRKTPPIAFALSVEATARSITEAARALARLDGRDHRNRDDLAASIPHLIRLLAEEWRCYERAIDGAAPAGPM